MFHICVENQSHNLNNSQNYTCHSKTLILLFCLSPSCSDVTFYLESHSMKSIVGLGIVSSFQLFFLLCSLPIVIPIFFLRIFFFQVLGGLCTDGTLWSLSTCFLWQFAILGWFILYHCVGNSCLLWWVFSSDFSVWTKVGVGTSFTLWGNWPWCPCNK